MTLCILVQDPEFDGLAPKKLGVTELNFSKLYTNLGYFIIRTKGKCRNLAIFFGFKTV